MKIWPTPACVAVVNEDIGIKPGEDRAFIKVKMQIWQVLELLLHLLHYLR
jgi:UDP-3-O-[3-hydroxymyristoyl] glucosamine N-acyltransferase